MKRQTIFVITALLLASLLLGACATAGQPTEEAGVEGPAATEAPAEEQPAEGEDLGVVQVATDATWPPFEMINEETREPEGFDIDLMNAVAEEAGLEIEYINVAFDPLLAGMATCQYDAAISAMTITEERQESMLFSDPYFQAGQVVTVRADNEEITGRDSLSGKVVGAQIGTTGAIQTEQIEGAELRTYDDVGLAFQDLMNGQIDAVIADNPLALGYVGQNPDQLKTVGEVFTDENYGIAVCKENTELLERINAGLAAVQEAGLIEDLTAKWIESSGE